MACLPTILCIGEDADLLGTRAMLLERLGAEVKRATSIAEALQQVAGENFDLIVLCHSLKESDAVAICDTVRERKPPPLILKITKSFGFEEERAQLLCDAIVDAHPRHSNRMRQRTPSQKISVDKIPAIRITVR